MKARTSPIRMTPTLTRALAFGCVAVVLIAAMIAQRHTYTGPTGTLPVWFEVVTVAIVTWMAMKSLKSLPLPIALATPVSSWLCSHFIGYGAWMAGPAIVLGTYQTLFPKRVWAYCTSVGSPEAIKRVERWGGWKYMLGQGILVLVVSIGVLLAVAAPWK